MDRDELLKHGRDALDLVKEACLLSTDTLMRQDGYDDANVLIDGLLSRLNNHYAPNNPRYHKQDELAAAFIVLAAYDPDTYRNVVQFCFRTFHGDLTRIDGLQNLETILAYLADDHNLCLKADEHPPILANEAYFPHFVRGADPASVLEAIRPLVENIFSNHVKPR